MNIEERTINVLVELSGMQDITKSTVIKNDLGLDSLKLVIMLLNIEEEFSIELDESDMNPYDYETVEDIINLVKKTVDRAHI